MVCRLCSLCTPAQHIHLSDGACMEYKYGIEGPAALALPANHCQLVCACCDSDGLTPPRNGLRTRPLPPHCLAPHHPRARAAPGAQGGAHAGRGARSAAAPSRLLEHCAEEGVNSARQATT